MFTLGTETETGVKTIDSYEYLIKYVLNEAKIEFRELAAELNLK